MVQAPLIDSLRLFTEILQGLDASDPKAAEVALNEQAPLAGPLVQSLVEHAEPGLDAGWLLPKEAGGIRFGRIAKDLDGYSIDAVWMDSPGPEHRHPNGEFDLCLARSGSPQFDGRDPGWVVYPPGSQHVPTVRGGEMLIFYFLPGGAIEFLPAS